MNTDDWCTLSYALENYKAMGYKYVDAPWIVPNSVNMLTCPSEDLLMKIAGTETSLVGSAEQSFLKMEFDGLLPKGKYLACTPCFRVEDANDGLHLPYFMKIELYRTDSVSPGALYDMVVDARHVMERLNYASNAWKQVITSDGLDILLNDVEVGSYGIRKLGAVSWVYGTGLALPRYRQAWSYVQR